MAVSEKAPAARRSLTRGRVLEAAVAIADAEGLAALTMRSLADALGVKAMSLYHYVANKEEILDGIVDAVFAEIELPDPTGEWRSEIRRRSLSARRAMNRHPWALALMETRTSPGQATLRHHDAVLGVLRAGGLSLELTALAYAVVDAYVYGFALQEASLPFEGPDSAAEVAGPMMAAFETGEFPHLVEFAVGHVMLPGYDFGSQFEFGLDLVLDGLAAADERSRT
jgi:AcrR family transcriptional regulator